MNESVNVGSEKQSASYGVSWLAYIRPTIFSFIIFALSAACGEWLGAGIVGGWSIGILTAASYLTYQIYVLRSIKLYVNQDGVWYFMGILPWASGYAGLKWQDIEQAVFYMGFLSWSFKSYKIEVIHRFGQNKGFVLKYIRFGNQAVEHINEICQERMHRAELS